MSGPTSKAKRRREGRGKLSTIELLPEAAEEHILWANAALRDRDMPQTEILRTFNARLADLGIPAISKGAFSRYSVRVAIEARKLEASRQITDAVLSRMGPGERTDSTLAAVELLKFRVLSLVMDEDEPDPKLLGAAALALSRLSSTALREAQGQRHDRREQREEGARSEERAKNEAAAKAVVEAGAKAGVSQDALQKITSLLTTGAF